MDDKDEWEEEKTDLDEYLAIKQMKESHKKLSSSSDRFGHQKLMDTNAFVTNALRAFNNGWVMTSLSMNAEDRQGIRGLYGPQAEVTLKIQDPTLIQLLGDAIRAMSE